MLENSNKQRYVSTRGRAAALDADRQAAAVLLGLLSAVLGGGLLPGEPLPAAFDAEVALVKLPQRK